MSFSGFSDAGLNEKIEQLLASHVSNAGEPDYKVALNALSAVQRHIEVFTYSGDDLQDFGALLETLSQLSQNYNDRTGEYSSGKGEIGSFVIDLRQLRPPLTRWQRFRRWLVS